MGYARNPVPVGAANVYNTLDKGLAVTGPENYSHCGRSSFGKSPLDKGIDMTRRHINIMRHHRGMYKGQCIEEEEKKGECLHLEDRSVWSKK